MKKLQKRKGFTLTELAIVIAVIAILIAVLVPTFVSLINKANNSSDEQTVTNLNTALSIDEAENNKPESLCAVWDILEDAGYNAKPTPNYSDNEFYWYKAENRVVIVCDNVVTFPSEYAGINITDATADTGKALCNTAVATTGSTSGVTFAKMDASTDEKEAHNDYFAESGHCTYCDCVSSVYMEESGIITLNDTTLTKVNTTAANFIIPNGITIIGENTFNDGNYSSNTTLESVVIPESVTTIDTSAFEYCTSLTSVNIPSSVTKIGTFAFDKCTSLTTITIPSSVATIGDGAFARCDSLENITIENGVTEISKYCFYERTSLKTVNIPDSITKIGIKAFYNCKALVSLNIDKSKTWYYSTQGYDYASSTCNWSNDTDDTAIINELISTTTNYWYTQTQGSTSGGSAGGNILVFPENEGDLFD